MKVISLKNNNSNTNTLNLTVNEPVTLSTIFGWDMFKEFAPEARIEDVVTYDEMDLSALASDAANLSVTDDTVIEIDVFGEHKPQVAATLPTQGKVEVVTGGGGLHKSVIIINGVTTVRQALNDRVANAFGKTREALQNMKIHVNDSAATLDSVLKDGDEIALEERKAGQDGCEDYLTIEDGQGCERQYLKEDTNQSLMSFLSTDEVLDDFGGEIDESDLIDDIDEVDGVDFVVASENIVDMLLASPVANIHKVTLTNFDFAITVEEDTAADDDDAVAADGVSAAQAVPAEGVLTVGPVMVSQGGTQPVKMMVTSGKTTVKDVVMTSKILNTFAMTSSQMAKMIFNVNDVRSTIDQVLRAGDTLVIEAPKCGQDGSLR